MAKTKVNVKVEVKKAVGVSDPDKMALYDDVAQFIANLIGADVSHVKPRTFKDETGKSKKTGSYGLAFELNGKLMTLEIVVKSDTVTIEDFIVEAVTNPNEDETIEDETTEDETTEDETIEDETIEDENEE